MADQLLVRAYNVGVGDCIYVRIPNRDEPFHVLIDCGRKGSADMLATALAHLEENLLPEGSAPGKKRLDLLVVTHRHEDHIKGFDPDSFTNIEIGNIWLSAAMNSEHPQAERAHALHSLARDEMRAVAAQGLALSPELEGLVSLYGIRNDGAMEALRETFPRANGIEPCFVHAGMSSRSGEARIRELRDATIRVLAPERDIDGFYLGEEADETLRAFIAGRSAFARGARPQGDPPTNISGADFRLLQSRMLSSAFAFAEKDSSIQNNMSVVLLIEWGGKRLLFVGDAEWHGKFRQGKHNGSWEVMWKKRKRWLDDPIDFLKVGHHGSINSTPRDRNKDDDYEINQIFNAILPLPADGEQPTAQAVVSTERSYYKPIPESDLLVELGRRVKNTRDYKAEFDRTGLDPATELKHFQEEEEDFLDKPQPLRTDLEKMLLGRDFVDVVLDSSD